MQENKTYQKILVIQTAFIGDVILATALIENLHKSLTSSELHVLVRKGNEGLFENHPYVKRVLVWNKRGSKYKSLLQILSQIRKEKYDLLINLQRFASSGFLTLFSKSKETRGFNKNPFSFFFSKRVPHTLGDHKHEIERNFNLISDFVSDKICKPKLYPSQKHQEKIKDLRANRFVIMAPGSVWKTKQLPLEKWIELCNLISPEYSIYLIGASSDHSICTQIKEKAKRDHIRILAGELSFLESAALMEKSEMNYVNDSAPLHLASSMNAPVTAFFCSTLPQFGFGPLSEKSLVVETKKELSCRPCGLHGKSACPAKHFECGYSIDITNFAV